MATIIHAVFNLKEGRFVLPEKSKDAALPQWAEMVVGSLRAFPLESFGHTDILDFYIVFHPPEDFWVDNGLEHHHLLAQYLFLSDSELINYLLVKTEKKLHRAQKFAAEKDKFIFLTKPTAETVVDYDLLQDGIFWERLKKYDEIGTMNADVPPQTSPVVETTSDNYQWPKDSAEPLPVRLPLLPMVHITFGDLFKQEEHNNKQWYSSSPFKIPRYIKVLDSSIWNQYVPFVDVPPTDNNNFNNRLKYAIENIARYKNAGAYNLLTNLEHADFQARLLFNAHLGKKGPHATGVSPFVFHSEKEMDIEIKTGDKEKEMAKQKIKLRDFITKVKEKDKFKWRILLVDDKDGQAGKDSFMSATGELEKKRGQIAFGKEGLSKDCNEKLTKRGNIENSLEKLAKHLGFEETPFILDTARTVDEALKKMQAKHYDLILLDYLLEEKVDGKGKRLGVHEYAFDLWAKLNPNSGEFDENAKRLGKRFWIMHASAYEIAVNERLQERGYAPTTSYWFIGRGASPTATPKLFQYNLLRLMTRQIELLINPLFGTMDLDNENGESILLPTDYAIEVLGKIYGKNDKNEEDDVSDNAVKYFPGILALKTAADQLKTDAEIDENTGEKKEAGSPLAEALYREFNATFIDHLIHLVYLTAHGTQQQWPKMLINFKMIRNVLNASAKGKTVAKAIEDYIISLHKQ